MKSSIGLALILLLFACSSARQTRFINHTTHQAKGAGSDSVTYAKLTFEADQKDYLGQMLGTWLIHTMQRQATLPEETLNISLQLNDDKTFHVATSCGDFDGTYSVKGVSIRFKNGVTRVNQCENNEQLAEMKNLLTSRVSLYTVNGNMLFLKDNSGNNVFRITR